MNTKDLLKKYWFLGIIAIALVVFIGAYAVDAYKNREITVGAKEVDGKSVAYSVNDEFGFADDLYETLYSSNGIGMAYNAYQRIVLEKAYETTDEMNNIAASYAQYALQQYGQEELMTSLHQMGYVNGTDDLINYYVDAQKQEKLVKDYFIEHTDDIITPYVSINKPRQIYQIVVTVDDVEEVSDENGNVSHVAHPTDEEQKKINDALEALKTQTFEEVALAYSEDGTAQAGGYLGVVDETNRSTYAKEFADECFNLESGQMSGIITSEFGFHIILNKTSDVNELLEDSSFLTLLQNANENVGIIATMEKGKALGFEIVDEELNTAINNVLGGEE